MHNVVIIHRIQCRDAVIGDLRGADMKNNVRVYMATIERANPPGTQYVRTYRRDNGVPERPSTLTAK
jgi:3D (Asp-Asp-Asp) domain-containing protein